MCVCVCVCERERERESTVLPKFTIEQEVIATVIFQNSRLANEIH